jgi:hypothetical protein
LFLFSQHGSFFLKKNILFKQKKETKKKRNKETKMSQWQDIEFIYGYGRLAPLKISSITDESPFIVWNETNVDNFLEKLDKFVPEPDQKSKTFLVFSAQDKKFYFIRYNSGLETVVSHIVITDPMKICHSIDEDHYYPPVNKDNRLDFQKTKCANSFDWRQNEEKKEAKGW